MKQYTSIPTMLSKLKGITEKEKRTMLRHHLNREKTINKNAVEERKHQKP